jgi:hypothetical protein
MLLSLVALQGCAFIGTRTDGMCDPARAFVASVGPDESREVLFHTVWGRGFKDEEEPVLYQKRCEHSGYEPARDFCAYLITHGAAEFSGHNAQRFVSCIMPDVSFGEMQLHSGEFGMSYGSSERGALIEVSFVEDALLGGMRLRIRVDGY